MIPLIFSSGDGGEIAKPGCPTLNGFSRAIVWPGWEKNLTYMWGEPF